MSNDVAISSLQQKIDGLNQQAWEARVNDSPKALEYSQESVKLSREINYSKGLAEGLRSLGFAYVRLYKNDEAAPLLQESLSLFQSLNDLKGQAVVYEYLGIIERNWGNLGASLEFLLKGNNLAHQTGPLEIEITSCYQIGVTYKHLGNHENALDYLYRALSLSKQIKFTLMESYATNIIGSIYFDNGDYQHALDCYQQGLVIRRLSNDKWGEAGSLDNIGFTYLKLNDLHKAIDYCKQSLQITQSTGDKKGEANTLLHLAEIYQQAGDIGQASTFSNESLEIRKTRGDKRGEAEVLLFLADLYKNRSDTLNHKIFDWLSGALKIADEIKAQDLLSKAHYYLHEYYSKRENYQESLIQLEAHLQLEKELHKNMINQKVSNLEISHKSETISQRNKELTVLNEQIKKANDELKIEASLERVRTYAMGMFRSEDLVSVCKAINDELITLGFTNLRNTQIVVNNDDKQSYLNYEYSDYSQQSITEVAYNSHPKVKAMVNEMKKSKDAFFQIEITGDELVEWRAFRTSIGQTYDERLEKANAICYYFYSVGRGALGISTFNAITEKELQVLKRFRNVFELAYRRYTDVTTAEAQAREAKIEAALERVRSKSMAMHKSDELLEASEILFLEMQKLGIESLTAGYVLMDKEEKNGLNYTPDPSTKKMFPVPVIIPHDETVHLKQIVNNWKKGNPFSIIEMDEAETIKHQTFIAERSTNFTLTAAQLIAISPPKLILHNFYFKEGYLLIVGGSRLSEEQTDIMLRFTKVFQQTYTRFLDLQKAEAQAREAQIEAALERIRSISMAIRKSNELFDIIHTVFGEWKKLGLEIYECNINLLDRTKKEWTNWGTGIGEAALPRSFQFPWFDDPFVKQLYQDSISGISYRTYMIEGEELKRFLDGMFTYTDFKNAPEEYRNELYSISKIYLSHAFMQYGSMDIVGPEQPPASTIDILKRFAKVFEQAYTRYLDVVNAEAQAREAQIEAALERVRAKVMAMTNSKDLNETSLVFGEQLRKLGIDWQFSYFWLIDEDKNENVFWITWPDYKTSITTYTITEAEEFFNECLISWRAGVKIHDNYVPPEGVQAWLDTFQRIADDAGGVAKEVMVAKTFPTGVYYYDAMMKYGSFGISISKPASEEEKNIQIRFAIEFERAYTRFLDLKKAEAQAREAQIELAVERVRTKALAMHKSVEILGVVITMRNELATLNIPGVIAATIYLRQENGDVRLWDITSMKESGEGVHFSMNFDFRMEEADPDLWIRKIWDSVESYVVIEQNEEDLYRAIEWTRKYNIETAEITQQFLEANKIVRSWHPAVRLSNGKLTADFIQPPAAEVEFILSKMGASFDLAYTRFLDLQKAEAQAELARLNLIQIKAEKQKAEDALNELQVTQKQLIQSEKMASLGELTAGIAHEIQNPLNFVNNFSDVSNELLEEMKQELASGNTQQALEIVNDVKDNLEKILHHGKRADAIVKGMLQHSRTSSGQKELTDINMLADEYLRLAYHGLRAKDKFFNAKFETDLDPLVNKINVVPQEIGRVILNLINNSFYAVSEKKKNAANGYDPVVSVSTRKVNDTIEIKVKDNGNGIPQKVLDKIFQPFFTTKPTGQGTGLGLSLSYDIITKGHSGEIKVITSEGNGSEFIISLPAN